MISRLGADFLAGWLEYGDVEEMGPDD